MKLLPRIFYQLYKWTAGSGPKNKTLIHPDYKRLVQFAFEIEGQKFYEFKSLHDMPARRFKQFNYLLEDHNRRMNQPELLWYIDEIMSNLEKNSVAGITAVTVISKHLRSRIRVGMDTDLYLRLISCAYFTLDENLLEYDWDVGTERIKLFEEQGIEAFFLSEPMRKFLPSMDISEGDLAIFFQQRKLMKDYLKQLIEIDILSPRDTEELQRTNISS